MKELICAFRALEGVCFNVDLCLMSPLKFSNYLNMKAVDVNRPIRKWVPHFPSFEKLLQGGLGFKDDSWPSTSSLRQLPAYEKFFLPCRCVCGSGKG